MLIKPTVFNTNLRTFCLLVIVLNLPFISPAQGWQWANAINGPSQEDEIDAVAADQQANVYISGKFEDSLHIQGYSGTLTSVGMADIMLIKYDENGHFLWQKHWGGIGEDNVFDAVCDADNNLIISGYFQDTLQLDNHTLVAEGGFDAFIAKLNSNGNVLWAKQFGGTADDGANEVSVAAYGQIIVCADSDGDFTCDGISFSNTGDRDAYILSIQPNGTTDWIRAVQGAGNARSKAVAVDNGGNVFFGGDFFGPKAVVDEYSVPHPFTEYGNRDAFLSCWTATGAFKWAKSWGGTGNDLCKGVAVNAVGEVSILGPFENTIYLENAQLTSAGQTDFFLWKLDSTGIPQWLRHISSPVNVLEGGEIETDGHNGVVFGMGMLDTLLLESSNGFSVYTPPTTGAYPLFIQYNTAGEVGYTLMASTSVFSTFGEISRSNNKVFLDVVYRGLFIAGNDTLITDSVTNKDAGIVCIQLPDQPYAIAPILQETNIQLYPNPVENQLHIVLEEHSDRLQTLWQLTTVNSQIIQQVQLSSLHNTLNVSSLKKGTYILSNGTTILRFVKK